MGKKMKIKTIQEAQEIINAQEDRITDLETAIGALKIGDLSGGSTGEQLTLQADGTYEPATA